MNWALFLKKHWQQILFNSLAMLVFILFYGHFGNIIVDSFREAYIPTQMIQGQVLYKNIFCVYPPLAYIINAFLMLIFGTKLSVLFFAGFIASLGILNMTYIISNRYLPMTYSLSIILLILSVSILSPNVFNFIFPYSYGALYGILLILLSLYFGLKNKYLMMYFMYTLAICAKYEFILLLPFLTWHSGIKEFIKNIPTMILTSILVLLPLFIMGLRIDDISNIWQIVLAMSSTKTLYWFYSVTGLTYRPELIQIYGLNFLKVFIPLVFMYYFRHWTLILLTLAYFWFAISPEILVYVFPLILILFIFNYRNLSYNKKFLTLCCLAISVKLFFALTFLSYGIYFVPFALLGLFQVIPRRYKKSLMIIIFIMSFVFFIKNSQLLAQKNIKISTNNGTIYADDYYGTSIKKLVEFIDTNSKPDDKILILPECTAINFLANRASDNKFYSLIPLYVETFGEENILYRLNQYPPKYIVVSNYDTSNYYYSYFGQDYAKQIYEYILEKYNPIKQIGKGFVFIVFELKN